MSWSDPSWRKAAREYHAARAGRRTVDRLDCLRRLFDDVVSIDRAWTELNTIKGRAAEATVEALMHGLRTAPAHRPHLSRRRRAHHPLAGASGAAPRRQDQPHPWC